jgi:hypothetical protein
VIGRGMRGVRRADDGQVWSRAEALDSLGRSGGRRARAVIAVLGAAAAVWGAFLLVTGPPARAVPAPVTTAATCASVGIGLPVARIPAEGIPESSVVRLSRADADGTARMLVPQAFVLKSVTGAAGTVQLSVLVRSDLAGPDTVEQVIGSNADGSLRAAVLYDADRLQVLDRCRSGR